MKNASLVHRAALRNFVFGAALASLSLALAGCPQPAGETTATPIVFIGAYQTGGNPGSSDTTGLMLVFNEDPVGLSANDITVSGATKGALSSNGSSRTLALSNITVANGETISVSVASPSGYSISGSPKTAVVYRDTTTPPPTISFLGVEQVGGISGTANTTSLLLTFSADPATLTASNISVSGASTGELSGTGTTRTLAVPSIIVGNGGTVTVSVGSPVGCTIIGSPRTAVVYRDTRIAVTFEYVQQTGGESAIADTTGLILSFSVDPTTLTAGDITVSGATKGSLSGTGTTRTLAISDITVGNYSLVSVSVENPSGYVISGSPQTAYVYRDTRTPIAFTGVEQYGGSSGTEDSLGLTLAFDDNPVMLTISDITVSGATKGSLDGSGNTRTLSLSDITVGDGETVSVSIAGNYYYSISGSPRTAVVYRDTRTAIAFEGAEQIGGTSTSADTTGLLLSFSANPATLTADDITVVGAAKGALSGTGTTRTLALSGITVHNGESVSVSIASPDGYAISGSPRTAVVYRAAYIGMPYQGGILAYVLQPGDSGYVAGTFHGLIATVYDLSSGIQWYNGSYATVGVHGTAIKVGQSNSATIVSAQGAGSYAARLCEDHVNADAGTGVFSDWFLPSRDELNKLYLNQSAIGWFTNTNLPGSNPIYWSSSEASSDYAWAQSFANGDQDDYASKSYAYRVRAVRYF